MILAFFEFKINSFLQRRGLLPPVSFVQTLQTEGKTVPGCAVESLMLWSVSAPVAHIAHIYSLLIQPYAKLAGN